MATPISTLVDLQSLTDRTLQSKLIQVLSKVEELQMKVVHVKGLNSEEDRVAEVQEVALLKTEADKARLSPALADLAVSVTHFSAYVANLSGVDLSNHLFVQYKFSEMPRLFMDIQEQQLISALERWHSALLSVCKQLTDVLPQGWRPNDVVDDYDPVYVKEYILVQSLITGLGSDYVPASTWLSSLAKTEYVYNAYKERYTEDLQKCEEIFKDSRDMCACILAYNTLVNKWPKATPSEKRQQLKDLRKKFKHKLGKSYEMPELVNNRLQQAIADK